MNIEKIDKQRYRSHLNRVIVVFILGFASLSLAISQGLITVLQRQGGDNFYLNILGVAMALLISLSLIHRYRHHPFMHEVHYVWRLKQQINAIYRKLAKIKQRAYQDNDINALITLAFYYRACEQLYHLDDNTITLDSLMREQNRLNEHLSCLALSVDSTQYHQDMLSQL
ncbi:DUF3087 family protein [Thalassotalea ponticola]|uniref:DUF3087 family protein n=1 Tax=Thalassotalea ponticola TaxID=1523392 RepID=UPI0025B6219E|nr:DUF3087 family protein [Thalassotalea ponticola]MDN3653113.1 DUF3087 family protein [Thalassotalea ponticola]